jgi:hypothetical protein
MAVEVVKVRVVAGVAAAGGPKEFEVLGNCLPLDLLWVLLSAMISPMLLLLLSNEAEDAYSALVVSAVTLLRR